MIIPTIEKKFPFTMLSKYPAAPKPDSIKSSLHDHAFLLYNPTETTMEVIPRTNKKPGPINIVGPNGNKTIKEIIDIVNKTNPLTTVNIIISIIPSGIFFLIPSTCYINNSENITFGKKLSMTK